MAHAYRVTLRRLTPDPTPRTGDVLDFEVTNHDELIQLVTQVAALDVLPESEVAEFTIGLKLFSEIMLRHRREPLFADLFQHFGAFMKQLKGRVPAGRAVE